MSWWVWVLLVLGSAGIWIFISIRSGNLPFWKVVKDHPYEAAQFFRENDCWYIDVKPGGRDVLGPFLFYDPTVNRTIKLYADADKIEKSQDDFVSGLKQTK